MKTDNIVILNREHPDFKRLYWNTDKEKIKHILSRVNVKYLRGLIRQFIIPYNDWDTIAAKDLRLFIRYDGYQFTVSEKTVIKELYRRENNMTRKEKISLIPQERYANAYVETWIDINGVKHEDFRLGGLYENKKDLPNHYEISCARAIHLGAVKIEIKPL